MAVPGLDGSRWARKGTVSGVQILRSNRAQYEYEIHALVKSFYPAWDLKILTPESSVKDRKIWEIPPAMELEFQDSFVRFTVYDSLHNTSNSYTWWDADRVDAGEYKDTFGRFLYTSLQEETGRSLPWGNLTGVRPTKLIMNLLEEGRSGRDIALYLEEQHFVSREKIALGIEIAERERRILRTLHYEDGYSLYIGIPFCPTTCLYCSFTSYPIGAWRERVGEYLDALEREMEETARMCEGKILDTVYIGGGTPTSLSEEELDRLLAKLRNTFDFSTVQEFTVEAGRADSITGEKLKVMRKHGVTRISVNPQTMQQKTLDLIGRRHTAEQVRDAFLAARKAGFDNINMDIILGLPGETAEDVRGTIEQILALTPDSLTVHSLAVKRASALNRWIEEHGVTAYNNTEETMQIAALGARSMGMSPYYLYRQKNMSGNFENVGYCTEGKYGVYNILIMEEKQTIVALGAGSITKKVTRRTAADGRADTLIERCENVKEVAQYIERVGEMIERKRGLLGDDPEVGEAALFFQKSLRSC